MVFRKEAGTPGLPADRMMPQVLLKPSDRAMQPFGCFFDTEGPPELTGVAHKGIGDSFRTVLRCWPAHLSARKRTLPGFSRSRLLSRRFPPQTGTSPDPGKAQDQPNLQRRPK
jgi:hypothetical protein